MRIEIHPTSVGYAVCVQDKQPWVYAETRSYNEARDRAHSFAKAVNGQVYSMLPVSEGHVRTRALETLA